MGIVQKIKAWFNPQTEDFEKELFMAYLSQDVSILDILGDDALLLDEDTLICLKEQIVAEYFVGEKTTW